MKESLNTVKETANIPIVEGVSELLPEYLKYSSSFSKIAKKIYSLKNRALVSRVDQVNNAMYNLEVSLKKAVKEN